MCVWSVSRPTPTRASVRLAAAIGQVPRVLHAERAGAWRRGHHALLVRGKAAVSGAIPTAIVLGAPWPIDFARSRPNVERGERGQGQHDRYGADCFHGESPMHAPCFEL